MFKISMIVIVVIGVMICVLAVYTDQAREYTLAFYMLDSEEDPITALTPTLSTKTFTEKNNLIIADYDPHLSVETKDSFFQTTFLHVMNNPKLTPEEKNELASVKTWVMVSPKKFVGFQLIKK